MTNKIFYIAPRQKKHRRRPVHIGGHEGAASLFAAVIGQAVNDYVCGNAEDSEAARLFFMSSDYDYYRSWLGIVPDLMPDALRDLVMEVKA